MGFISLGEGNELTDALPVSRILRANLAAAETRTLAELFVRYLDLMIFRQESGFYPSSFEAEVREGPTCRTVYTRTEEPQAMGFALVATSINSASPARSFCFDATGAFVQARGSDTLLAVEGRCQKRTDSVHLYPTLLHQLRDLPERDRGDAPRIHFMSKLSVPR